MEEEKQGISQFKRSGVAALFLWFLMNSSGELADHIIAAAVCIAYMILDGLKHRKAK